MSNNIHRFPGVSELDYLWTHFGGYKVSNTASYTPQDNVILTELALVNLIRESTGGGITELIFEDNPDDPNTTRLRGLAANGELVSFVVMPKEVHVQSFSHRTVTLTDIDNGCTFPVDSEALSLVLTNGTEFLVSLEELNLIIRGGNTDTITTKVTNGVVNSRLKIDYGNNILSPVELKTSNDGVWANLKISENSELEITKEDDGIAVKMPIGSGGYSIKFDLLTLSLYQLLDPKDPNTVYFITDKPYIYLNGVRYGIDAFPGEVPIISLTYDADQMLLAYKKADGSDTQYISLGPATENTPGMMSTETYIELLELRLALDGIVNNIDTLTELVSQAGVKLEFGIASDGVKPLNLKNSNGDIISSVNIDVESYLDSATSKIANLLDVIDSGGTVTCGHYILILTLTSGNKLYVDLNSLIDVYTGVDTNSISLSVNDNQISANLNISEEDLVLYIYDDGIRAHFLIVRLPGKIVFYGKTLTDDDKLAELLLSDLVINIVFVKEMTKDLYALYPPRYVDGEPYDCFTNPIDFGNPYFIIVFGSDVGEPFTSYLYNDYISINPILNSLILSPNEGNLLTKDENGYLYGSLNWIEVN